MTLGYFEELLEKSGSGFLVSGGLTCVDFGLFYIIFELAEEDNVPDFVEKFHFPKLGAFLESMQNRRYERAANGSSLYTYVEGKGSPRR